MLTATEPSRDSSEIYLLGCGRSILDLTLAQKARIARSPCVLGLNKFVLFEDVAGITPTHVWFVENHWPAPIVLTDIFAHCRRRRLRKMAFIFLDGTGPLFRGYLRYGRARVGQVMRRALGRKSWYSYLLPPGATTEFVTKHDWLVGGDWAERLDQPMFHLRTSFTCALNYLVVRFPGSHIRLVGTDFNSDGYFFADQLKRIGNRWDDWTTVTQQQERRHFATISYEGKTVFDAFPYMREQANRAGVRLSCPNPESEVVRQGLADYEPIPEAVPGELMVSGGYS